MEKSVKLGDIEVARIGLGTNRLTKTRDNISLVKAAVAAGLQMIDTAHSYTGGQSEETIGDALSPIPADASWQPRAAAGAALDAAAPRCSGPRWTRAFAG